MSDSNNNGSSPNPNSNSGVLNWRVLILVTIIIGVVAVAIFGNGDGFGAKRLKLEEFQQALGEGRVILDDKKQQLQLLTSDSTSEATLQGYMLAEGKEGLEQKELMVRCEFNNQLVPGEISSRLSRLNYNTQVVGEFPQDKQAWKSINLKELVNYINRDQIVSNAQTTLYSIKDSGDSMLCLRVYERSWPQDANAKNARRIPFEVSFNSTSPQGRELQSQMVGIAEFGTKSETFSRLLYTLLPFLLIGLILYMMFRSQMKNGARGAMNFGKSRAKLLNQDKTKVTFKDVAGISEAKEELWEIVEYLRDPKKFQKLGGTIPRGILMVGSPGTGKTLLAKAIAGEANVPFFSISGSDFVEMFVGVGASRVRDMFEQGKKSAPCLIFIDEIDAVGRHRGHGVGGGNDEREQTLNALLVEMDGFDTTEGIIIIAATNRPDVLDPALLRPGRFDRQVTVNLPDVKGREEILKVHAKKIKLAESANLATVAKGTPGFSGAELANLLNESALIAARKGLSEVNNPELEEARDKVRWGRERRSLAISDKEKRVTAVHEAGHAICLLKCTHTEPLHKVTIIPRGPSLGSTMWLPAEDKYNTTRNEMLDSLVVAMGGRCAEEIVFGDVTSGATGDIRMATSMARRMVCSFGMSEKLGMVEYDEGGGEVFLARDLSGRTKNYSEETARIIDSEVRELIGNAYQRALYILRSHRQGLDSLTGALLEYETLDGHQCSEVVESGTMSNPPASVLPPGLPELPPIPQDPAEPAATAAVANTNISNQTPTTDQETPASSSGSDKS